MLDFKRCQIELENILLVREFPDVFPEELSGIPLEREVDLSIDILLGMIGMNHVCISVKFSVFFIAKMHDS